MKNTLYSASFTAGSLLYRETTALLPLLLKDDAKLLVKDEIKQNNLLNINSQKARERTIIEIQKRMAVVDHKFWETYLASHVEGQKIMLFYLCLKVYKLMFDYHFNVTVPQWNSSNPVIEPFLFQIELNEIGARVDYVDKWTESTKGKTISVYMRILKDIDMLDQKTLRLKSILIIGEFWDYFVKQRELWFLDACLLNPIAKRNLIESVL